MNLLLRNEHEKLTKVCKNWKPNVKVNILTIK